MGNVDLAGLAALVTAVSGLIATLGALYLGSRKQAGDVSEELVRQLLERETRRLVDEAEEKDRAT